MEACISPKTVDIKLDTSNTVPNVSGLHPENIGSAKSNLFLSLPAAALRVTDNQFSFYSYYDVAVPLSDKKFEARIPTSTKQSLQEVGVDGNTATLPDYQEPCNAINPIIPASGDRQMW